MNALRITGLMLAIVLPAQGRPDSRLSRPETGLERSAAALGAAGGQGFKTDVPRHSYDVVLGPRRRRDVSVLPMPMWR